MNNNLISPGPEELTEGLTAFAAIFVLLIVLVVLAFVVLILISNCKIFKKAGEKWWKGLIPLYNSWVETKITGLNWWWFLIYFGLLALTMGNVGTDGTSNVVLSIGLSLVGFNYSYNLAKKFGKTPGFAVLVSLLPIVGLPILAFGSAQYDEKVKTDPNGIFSIKDWK